MGFVAMQPIQISRPKMRLAFLGLFLIAFLVRLPLLSQSLWYDEMYLLLKYILKPWANIFSGEYSPNNHVLFSAIAKLFSLGTKNVGELTMLVRLPSLLAGSLAAVALAWPIWRTKPYHAILLGLIIAVHPWLVSFSGWARGYALLLLLAILSTNLLPITKQLANLPYTLTLTAALYTQPIAILLVPGHAAAVWLLHRSCLTTWFRSISVAGVLTLGLYSPFLVGAGKYFSQSQTPAIQYPQFLIESFRFAQVGDNETGYVAIPISLLVIIAGGYCAWRSRLATAGLFTFTVASIGGLIVPLLIPAAGEVRAMLWLIPLYCIGATAILTTPFYNPALRLARIVTGGLLMFVLIFQCYQICQIPAQPILPAVEYARQLAGNDENNMTPVIGIYMAAIDTIQLYDGFTDIAYDLPTLRAVEMRPANNSGSPIAVIFYESFLQRDQQELWEYMRQNYVLVQRLPGRISPAAIYRKKT
jgi:hypothetical protein